MIPKEMKYNLHYGDVREDVLPPPHGTNTSCSLEKLTMMIKESKTIISKKMGLDILHKKEVLFSGEHNKCILLYYLILLNIEFKEVWTLLLHWTPLL